MHTNLIFIARIFDIRCILKHRLWEDQNQCVQNKKFHFNGFYYLADVSGQDFYQVLYVADELRVKQTYSKRDKKSGRFLVNADTTCKTSKQTIICSASSQLLVFINLGYLDCIGN